MRRSEIRLALFSDTWAPQVNGVARTLERLVDAVRIRGGSARVFTTTDPHANMDAHVVRYPSVPFPLYGQLRLSAPTAASVAAQLRAFRPTMVHVATPFGVGLAARAAAHRLSLPLITSYHTSFAAYASHYGLALFNAPSWRYLRWFHNGGRSTLCPTSAIRDELGGRGFERLRLWGRGVDCSEFDPNKRSRTMRMRFGANAGTTIVAYVGRMAREKGLDDLLDAARSARQSRKPLVFAFAGDGPYLESCQRRAPANCVFTGRIEGAELSQFYASADMFVFPSRTDTFGNVLLEAMASGLPILAADTPSAREVVGCAGEYYIGGNSQHLGRCIEAMVSASCQHGLLSKASRVRAQSFSWGRVFDDLLASYEEVGAENRARSSGHRAMRLNGLIDARPHLRVRWPHPNCRSRRD